jgi:hypothetical protein
MIFEEIRRQLSNSIVSKDAEFNTKIIQEIISKDIKKSSLAYLENELKTLNQF